MEFIPIFRMARGLIMPPINLLTSFWNYLMSSSSRSSPSIFFHTTYNVKYVQISSILNGSKDAVILSTSWMADFLNVGTAIDTVEGVSVIPTKSPRYRYRLFSSSPRILFYPSNVLLLRFIPQASLSGSNSVLRKYFNFWPSETTARSLPKK